ncbi:hypothetical protein DMN91_008125 [Ooceraea biroi]|uniref:Double jelly roll-like domain-containing protein n=1 Tax=Ooceraea biroi TaxID=2015173 RepID=A0A026W783_OOCBI|nr:uncharacterized protein LOC105282455 [Ooceraea biroi]EZA51848.1 hypothetical protein X777_09614 [Ooceraea biroi]RLU19568.1 hypothetical protein DMN91_008125 [Ooceraea biroi]
MTEILNIGDEPIFDDRIVKIETHTYNPFANTTFGHSDEIKIPIQQQDLYTLPHESYLYIEGKLTLRNGEHIGPRMVMGSNCVAFMFDEIRYELDGVEINRNRNVGTTSTIKNYTTLSPDRDVVLDNSGWDRYVGNIDGHFNFCVPLSMLLGFCKDYKRVVINARHELILIRSRDDKNSVLGDPEWEPVIDIFKIQWRMPHVLLNEVNKLSMLRALESGRYLTMGFRSWDLYEYPLLQSTTKHSWAIKTVTHLEKPRYVVFALQTGRKNVMSANITQFDTCKLTNVKLYLNSEFYPYDDLNVDFERNKYAVLYDMYSRFPRAYYNCSRAGPYLSPVNFVLQGPFVVIDCLRQNESVKSATVDVRLEFDCKENVPPFTTAYCLIIHDRVVEYSLLTNVVRRIT